MLQVLFGLGAVIFVHELGHFLVAKACGVKCEKFYVGFDAFDIKVGDRVLVPRSLLKKQIGETEYGIGLLPFGGYVKMLGQDDNPGNMEEENLRARGQIDEDGNVIMGQAEAAGLRDKSQLDPRSFKAKSVIQRMAIISAGVVFNLIFAVLFAMLAFKSGVDYTPAYIGNVMGGGPAWENNLVGAEVRRINGQEINDDVYFRFIDMAQEIVFNGEDQPLEFEVIREGETETTVAQMLPRKGLNRDMMDFPMIGISPRSIPKIGADGVIDGNTAASATEPLKKGDIVKSVNGYQTDSDMQLRYVLNRDAHLDVEFEIERNVGTEDEPKLETLTSKIKPNPLRFVGFGVKWLPVTAIQKDSPASAAGVQVGDEIIKLDGQEPGNLLTFDRRVVKRFREDAREVDLEIKRGDESMTLKIKPRVPQLFTSYGPDQPIALDSLGVAVGISEKIDLIEPSGPAAVAGFLAGDTLKSVQYKLVEDDVTKSIYEELNDKTVNFIDDKTTWAEVHNVLQMLGPKTQLDFVVDRNGKEESLTLKTEASDELFLATRGIFLTRMQKHYKSKSWSDAFRLGYTQVWEDTKRVGKFLGKLVQGKVSPKNLGGPGTNALAATSEASQGTGRLLLFLTLLSANLAIVNFLPIPILDGGHMLFLAYEGLFRRPVSERVQILLTWGGLIFILGLMMFVVAMDIGRISSLM
jgi:regulator of sigma E protease